MTGMVKETFAIIAIAGPKKEIEKLKDKRFEKVYYFPVPDNYGEFPDTTGYTAKNWMELESNLEDPALKPFMDKCMDAALQFTNDREKYCDKLGYINILKELFWPKFGGKVFAVIGSVSAEKIPFVFKHSMLKQHAKGNNGNGGPGFMEVLKRSY